MCRVQQHLKIKLFVLTDLPPGAGMRRMRYLNSSLPTAARMMSKLLGGTHVALHDSSRTAHVLLLPCLPGIPLFCLPLADSNTSFKEKVILAQTCTPSLQSTNANLSCEVSREVLQPPHDRFLLQRETPEGRTLGVLRVPSTQACHIHPTCLVFSSELTSAA